MGTYQDPSDLKQKLNPTVALRSKLPTNKMSLVALLVIVLALLIAAGLWYRQATKPTASREETAAALEEAGAVEDNEAIAKLRSAYKDAATDEGKAEAAYFLAARYSSMDDHDNALKYFRIADGLYDSKNIDVILGVANAADEVDNKDLAREYYQKAIDFYKNDQGDEDKNNEIISFLEDKLNNL